MSKAVIIFSNFVGIIWLFPVIYITGCMKVIPERTNITYINPKYITWANFTVKRYGRKSDYYFGLCGAIKHTWTNNVTVDFLFYELLHNEYRRTFVEMHFKLCDMLNKDPYIGKVFASRGVTCPILSKEYFFANITIPTQDFPHVWPFEKSRIFISLSTTQTKEIMGEAYCDVVFKVDKKRKAKAK